MHVECKWSFFEGCRLQHTTHTQPISRHVTSTHSLSMVTSHLHTANQLSCHIYLHTAHPPILTVPNVTMANVPISHYSMWHCDYVVLKRLNNKSHEINSYLCETGLTDWCSTSVADSCTCYLCETGVSDWCSTSIAVSCATCYLCETGESDWCSTSVADSALQTFPGQWLSRTDVSRTSYTKEFSCT